MRGARGALEPLFHDGALDFRMAWIFIDTTATDDLHSAVEACQTRQRLAPDSIPRLGHVLRRSMARCLGWKSHVAWDTYFIYHPGVLWTEGDMPATPVHEFSSAKESRNVGTDRRRRVAKGTAEWTHALAEKSGSRSCSDSRTGTDLRSALEGAIREAAADKSVSGASADK